MNRQEKQQQQQHTTSTEMHILTHTITFIMYNKYVHIVEIFFQRFFFVCPYFVSPLWKKESFYFSATTKMFHQRRSFHYEFSRVHLFGSLPFRNLSSALFIHFTSISNRKYRHASFLFSLPLSVSCAWFVSVCSVQFCKVGQKRDK